jgi:hypothetical protein
VIHTRYNSLGEGLARRRDLCLTTYNTHNRQTSMTPVGFEPAIPSSELPQTYVLDCAATRIGSEYINYINVFVTELCTARWFYFTRIRHASHVDVSNILFCQSIINHTLSFTIHLSLGLHLHRFACGSHTRILRVNLLSGILFTFSSPRNWFSSVTSNTYFRTSIAVILTF